jgi:hypothetical protein
MQRTTKVNRTLRTLIATAALLGPACAGPGFAQNSYPRMIGGEDNHEVDYGPGPRGNILSSGVAQMSGSSENREMRYSGPLRVQTPPAGLVPHIVNSGENPYVVYVPATIDRSRLAMIGGDGSLPAEGAATRNPLARLFGGAPDRG